MNNDYFPELGRRLTPQEVAKKLNLDYQTVLKYYREIGGMRLGRIFLFFENRIVQALGKESDHALQEREKMGRGGYACGPEEIQEISEKERSAVLGVRTKKRELRRLVKADPHGVFHSGMGK
jgi:hypothetical protein